MTELQMYHIPMSADAISDRMVNCDGTCITTGEDPSDRQAYRSSFKARGVY